MARTSCISSDEYKPFGMYLSIKYLKLKTHDNRANEKSSVTLQLCLEKESQHHQPPPEVSLSIFAILLIYDFSIV